MPGPRPRPDRRDLAILVFTLGYIAAFSVWLFSRGNFEFIWYIATMLALIALVGLTLDRSQR